MFNIVAVDEDEEGVSWLGGARGEVCGDVVGERAKAEVCRYRVNIPQ